MYALLAFLYGLWKFQHFAGNCIESIKVDHWWGDVKYFHTILLMIVTQDINECQLQTCHVSSHHIHLFSNSELIENFNKTPGMCWSDVGEYITLRLSLVTRDSVNINMRLTWSEHIFWTPRLNQSGHLWNDSIETLYF